MRIGDPGRGGHQVCIYLDWGGQRETVNGVVAARLLSMGIGNPGKGEWGREVVLRAADVRVESRDEGSKCVWGEGEVQGSRCMCAVGGTGMKAAGVCMQAGPPALLLSYLPPCPFPFPALPPPTPGMRSPFT